MGNNCGCFKDPTQEGAENEFLMVQKAEQDQKGPKQGESNPGPSQKRKNMKNGNQDEDVERVNAPQQNPPIQSRNGDQKKDNGRVDDGPEVEKHKPDPDFGYPVDGPPEILNEKIKETFDKMRPFVFDQDTSEDRELPTLCWYRLENNAYYKGQWKNGQRHGKGKQIWADGTGFELFTNASGYYLAFRTNLRRLLEKRNCQWEGETYSCRWRLLRRYHFSLRDSKQVHGESFASG